MLESLKIGAKEPLALPPSASLVLLAATSARAGAGVEPLSEEREPAAPLRDARIDRLCANALAHGKSGIGMDRGMCYNL